ncbi:hypothetical protein J4442_03720 [Candidatus Woesearchaeota archaeon]|nr:hypothetical protein [Candidatus Woesearchaeota archaeon]
MELVDFIVKAKKQTYASGKPARKLEDGFEEFVYEEGGYKYRDKYHAEDPKPFGGEEIVWQNGKAIWIMNYYGYMLSDNIDSKRVYGFLRKAMSLVDEQRPFRGPSHLKEGDFEYIDEGKGTLDNFKGTERILYKGEDVYRLEYHGGRVQ